MTGAGEARERALYQSAERSRMAIKRSGDLAILHEGLGISGRDRDAAAALAVDGRIVSAATEESFARVARHRLRADRRVSVRRRQGLPRRGGDSKLRDVDEMVAVDDCAARCSARRALDARLA